MYNFKVGVCGTEKSLKNVISNEATDCNGLPRCTRWKEIQMKATEQYFPDLIAVMRI